MKVAAVMSSENVYKEEIMKWLVPLEFRFQQLKANVQLNLFQLYYYNTLLRL